MQRQRIINTKETLFYLLFLLLINCISCHSQNKKGNYFNPTNEGNYTIHNEFKKYFDQCGVKGSIAIYDKNKQHWILSDTIDNKHESLPASTFKIINLLIALETKVIKDENEIVKWIGKTDTIKYGYRPEIYRDMTVEEAFKVSAGWVFIELAKKIGKDNYKKYLTACNYGNINLSNNDNDFWNFGNFAISPINQVEFLINLYEDRLPFSKRNIEIVKKVMVAEEADKYLIRAKTGWTRENNTNTGWWIGYMEANNKVYFFATRLLQDRKYNRDDFGSCRKEITKKVFSDLGLVNFINNTKENTTHIKAIDHVPIVVNNLEQIKHILKNELHFTIKEGKPHEGINNCFVKFEDDNYLEFTSPIDETQSIGKYYTDFLKNRQGGTSLAIKTENIGLVIKHLIENKISFSADSNSFWNTIDLKNEDLFYIEYANKTWKEKPINTSHSNTANSLSAIYIMTNNIEKELGKYRTLGFIELETGHFLEAPYHLIKIGSSNLYLMDVQKSNKLKQLKAFDKHEGVCGFQIKVASLKKFNELIKTKNKIKFKANRTTIFLEEYNLFMTFNE